MQNKIAIIANADSFWTQRYIENVSLKLSQKIVLISASNKNYKEYFSNAGIKVITTKADSNSHCQLYKHFSAIITSINTLNAIKREKPDIIHIHYAYPYIMRLIPYISKNVKIIITYWGSDLLRVDDKILRKYKGAVKKANRLVTMTSELKNKLIRIYGKHISKKISVIDMGISAFDKIDERRNNVSIVKKRFIGSQNREKTVITIGYNAGLGQQHLKVLNALADLPQCLKDNLFLVLPLTYQRDDESYLKTIDEKLKKIHIQSMCLVDFMNDDQIADLCISTDIFINAQITDALSSSMLEHFYSGSVVINGDWLHYEFLNEAGIKYFSFSDFYELKDLIVSIIDQHLMCKENNANALILKRKCSWSASREKWDLLYCSLN